MLRFLPPQTPPQLVTAVLEKLRYLLDEMWMCVILFWYQNGLIFSNKKLH